MHGIFQVDIYASHKAGASASKHYCHADRKSKDEGKVKEPILSNRS